MEYVFIANGLSKIYGKNYALKKVNLAIPKGAIFGFVGENGAGKTTLIRLICGLNFPSAGTFRLFDEFYNKPGIFKARRRIAAVVESPALARNLTAEDNLIAQSLLLGLPATGIEQILNTVGLSQVIGTKKKVNNFSLGMRQRLALAVALLGDPEFIIMDEPMNGLDPHGIVAFRELIVELNRKGITFLISSHNLEELARVATHYAFIHHGEILEVLSVNEIDTRFRTYTRLVIEDSKAEIEPVLIKLGCKEYEFLEHEVRVYQTLPFYETANAFMAAGLKLTGLVKCHEDLESYYLELIGGRGHA